MCVCVCVYLDLLFFTRCMYEVCVCGCLDLLFFTRFMYEVCMVIVCVGV